MDSFCQVTRGFFIKRSCGCASLMQCEHCQRAICQQHQAVTALPRILCVECEPGEGDRNDDQAWGDDYSSAYYYRSRYYGSGYTPIAWDEGDQGSADAAAPADPSEAKEIDPLKPDEADDSGDDDDGVSAFDS